MTELTYSFDEIAFEIQVDQNFDNIRFEDVAEGSFLLKLNIELRSTETKRSRKPSKNRNPVFMEILKDMKLEILDLEGKVTQNVLWADQNLDREPIVADMVQKFITSVERLPDRNQYNISSNKLKMLAEKHWKSVFLNKHNKGRSVKVEIGTKIVLKKGLEKVVKKYSRRMENPKPIQRDENGRFCKSY
jgi:hypothetical protein